MAQFPGKIIASRIIILRFSQSGYTSSVKAKPGQKVNKGEILATLDPQPVQNQLDVELADFRRIRAEFDDLSRKIPEAQNEDEKGLKEIAQSKLDVSVKAVEKIKYDLDHLSLVSPVNGIILDTNSLVAGIYVTPSSNPIIVADLDSFVFEVSVPEATLSQINLNNSAQIQLAGGQSLNSKITWISPEIKNEICAIHLEVGNKDNLHLGQTGTANL